MMLYAKFSRMKSEASMGTNRFEVSYLQGIIQDLMQLIENFQTGKTQGSIGQDRPKGGDVTKIDK